MRARDGLVSTIGFALGALGLGLGVLNFLSGIVGSVWLVAVGHWFLPIATLLVGAFAIMAIGIALLPGMLLLAPGAALAERSKILVAPFLLAGSAWTSIVMTAWCVGVFHWLLRETRGEHLIPTLLLAYATASGPWTYMAAKESQQDSLSASFWAALFCQLGCIALMVVSWGAQGAPEPGLLFKAYGTVMAVFVAGQSVILAAMLGRDRAW